MKASAAAVGALHPMYKGEKPFDAAAIPNAMSRIEIVCSDWNQFWPENSQSAAGLETRVEKAIWSDAAGFQRSSDAYFAALKALAAARDEPSFKANFSALSQTCSACHQTYRGPDN